MKAQKLPSGNFRVQLLIGHDKNGKRIMKSFTASREWEALKMADDYLKGGMAVVISDTMTVYDAMTYYIKAKDNLLSPSTINGYEMIRDTRLQLIRDKKINTLTFADIQAAVNHDGLRLSRKSIVSAVSLLNSSLVLQGIEINLKRITYPPKKAKKKDLPDAEVVIGLLVGTEVELPCLLAIWLSLRISEVRGLQFRDVSKDGKTITVCRARLYLKGENVLRENTKTEESTRTNSLPLYIYELIQKVPHEKPTDFIVDKSYSYITKHFRAIMAAHGYNINFHKLRHEFATTLNDLGVPGEYIQKLGGWATNDIMKKVYTHTTNRKEAEYQKTIDDFFYNAINKSHESHEDNPKSVK